MPTTLRYSIRLRLIGEEVFFGPGVCELFERIEQTGSLRLAATEMQMSYTKGWKMLRNAEAELGCRLIARKAGGVGGGSSRLTEEGRVFLACYRAFEKQVDQAAERCFADCFGQIQRDETDQKEASFTDETD